MSTQTTERVDLAFEIKSVTKDEHDDEIGHFEGLAAVFGNRDLGGDIIEPGAFTATLKRRHRKPKMFWGHNSFEPPIGTWEELEETDRGLRVKGRLFLELERSRDVFVGMREKELNGLSIGYSIAKNGSEFDAESRIRRLTKLDLWEISIVNFPMNERARVGAVKAAMCNGTLPSDRDIEWWLRHDGGFSQDQAKRFIAKGYRGLVPHDPEVDEVVAGLDRLISVMRGAA